MAMLSAADTLHYFRNLLTLGPIHNPNPNPNLNPDIVSKMLRLSGCSSPIRIRILLRLTNRLLVVVVVVVVVAPSPPIDNIWAMMVVWR